jgi:hypothetical protein
VNLGATSCAWQNGIRVADPTAPSDEDRLDELPEKGRLLASRRDQQYLACRPARALSLLQNPRQLKSSAEATGATSSRSARWKSRMPSAVRLGEMSTRVATETPQ